MKDQILLYRDMCNQEKVQTLQRGMNYRLRSQYSVFLMSQSSNAPYNDRVHPDGITIEYEGHDIVKTKKIIDPKKYDQPIKNNSGTFTQNGLFINAVLELKKGLREPEIIRVYEKVLPGIWSEKGFFKLINYIIVNDGIRNVIRFILEETEVDIEDDNHIKINEHKLRTRIIPTEIKKLVWERDNGQCVLCGKTDELHFDHDLPYAKGGTSLSADNVKILCARHNLKKSDNIE